MKRSIGLVCGCLALALGCGPGSTERAETKERLARLEERSIRLEEKLDAIEGRLAKCEDQKQSALDVLGEALGATRRENLAKATTARCDNAYVALNGQVANELDSVTHGLRGECGATTSEEVVACMVETHANQRNPRNEGEPVYVVGDPSASCQVGLKATSASSVRFAQFVRPESTHSRTFSVMID